MLKSIRNSWFKKRTDVKRDDSKLGHIALSLSGRDQGSYCIITEIAEDDYVMIADGKIRRVEKPKKKKLKHLRIDEYTVNPQKIVLGRVMLTNSEARSEIAKYITHRS